MKERNLLKKENMMESVKPWEEGCLQVKEDCPYMFNGDKLFFWMGDTAWLIFHKLKREEIRLYLRNRAEKGFNVIQATAVHYLPALNAYGEEAFPGQDIDSNYWSLVDFTIKEAEELGLYVALLPHWGGLASVLTKEQMEKYVLFLAKRYGMAPNIIWVTGGDTKGSDAEDYWRSMGQILRRECPEKLITFHPFGRTSSIDYFPDEDWMDFHMFQSGHRRYDQFKLNQWDDNELGSDEGSYGLYYGEDNWRYVRDVSKLKNRRPILDAEPSYEHIHQGLHKIEEPYWSAEQVRRYGWWSVLGGACGFTYGHNSIMQFYDGVGKAAFFAKLSWKDALHGPAGDAMVHMKRIMEHVLKDNWKHYLGGRDSFHGETLLGGGCVWQEGQMESNALREERILVFHAGPWILCYTYTGKTIELDGKQIKEKMAAIPEIKEAVMASSWWMHPESGVESYFGDFAITDEILNFPVPKGDDSHHDWLLILKIK